MTILKSKNSRENGAVGVRVYLECHYGKEKQRKPKYPLCLHQQIFSEPQMVTQCRKQFNYQDTLSNVNNLNKSTISSKKRLSMVGYDFFLYLLSISKQT